MTWATCLALHNGKYECTLQRTAESTRAVTILTAEGSLVFKCVSSKEGWSCLKLTRHAVVDWRDRESEPESQCNAQAAIYHTEGRRSRVIELGHRPGGEQALPGRFLEHTCGFK